MEDNLFDEFLIKLKSFVKKYYVNALLKGCLYFIFWTISYFLVLLFLENFYFFSSSFRFSFFIFYCLVSLCLVSLCILRPIFKYLFWNSNTSLKQTIDEIAKHFPHLKDRLIHLVDLQASSLDQESELILASINQRVREFRPYQFAKSIKFKKHWKLGVYILIPFILFSIYFFIKPNQVKGSTHRLLHFTSEFEKEFPFKIEIVNPVLSVDYSEDFTINIKLKGESIPADIYIVIDDYTYLLKKEDPFNFSYTFKKVFRNVNFKLKALDYISPEYSLKVLSKAMIMDIKLKLTYPAYTGKSPQIIENSGDVDCIEGTRIEWFLQTKNMDYLNFHYGKDEKFSGNPIKISKIARESMAYFMTPVNHFSKKYDTLHYTVSVFKDAFPLLVCEEIVDSLYPDNRLYLGSIMDDYGFSSLCVHKEILSNDEVVFSEIDTLQIMPNTRQDFNYFMNLQGYPLGMGQSLRYYFEVKDNDALQGYKSAKSSIFEYKKENVKELEEKLKKSEKEIQKEIQELKRQIDKSSSVLDKLTKDLVNSKSLNWEQQQAIQQAIDAQLSLFKQIENLQKELEKNRTLEDKLNTISPELAEKQKLLEDLLKDLMSPENKKEMEDLKKLLEEQVKPEKLQEKLSEWKEKQRDLQKEMERNSEIYKRMDFEKTLEKSMQKLSEAKENLKKLNQEMKSSVDLNEDLQKKQEEVIENLEDLDTYLKETEEKNKALSDPTKFKRPEELLKQSKDLMQKAKEFSDKKDKNSTEKQQEEAEDKLGQIEDEMDKMLDEMEQEEEGEDADLLRILLKTIINTSKKQEDLLVDLLKIKVNDPMYAEIIKKQGELKNSILLITDSISAISVRQPKVASVTKKEVKQILQYNRSVMNSLMKMNSVLYQRSLMRNSQATAEQQYLITSLNNLALLLSESLDQMKMSMKSKGNSSKKSKGKPSASCSNPNNSKKKMKDLKNMQDELNKRLKDLQKRGQTKPEGSSGKNGMSKDFAKAAAQQEMIRRILQEMISEMKSGDPKTAGLLNQIMKDMEETERDLVNKVLNQQTMGRQQIIDQRLLEAENSEMKREFEEAREATEGKDIHGVSPYLEDVLKEKLKNQKESIKFEVPELRPYYDGKVREYLWK